MTDRPLYNSRIINTFVKLVEKRYPQVDLRQLLLDSRIEPYAVSDDTDYTIPVHAEARGLMNTGIEIRQDLISDAAGEKAWADRLARIFGEIEPLLRAQQLI